MGHVSAEDYDGLVKNGRLHFLANDVVNST
jgi:hypothetical protein